MKTTIGVMGSVSGYSEEASRLAYALGQAIARHDCIIVTGACPGLPYDAVRGAKAAGGLTVGVSPGHHFAEHTIKYNSPSEGFDVIIYTGSGLMGREITGVRSCDVVVLVGGRSGTLGEFAIAYDEAKVIGVVKGSGGISEYIETLVQIINKDTGAQVIYDDDPHRLIECLLELDEARRAADRLLVLSPPPVVTDPVLADNLNDTQEAIAAMEREVRLLQSNLAEQRNRLEAFRDVAKLPNHAEG